MEDFLAQYGYIALAIGTFFEGETAILVASSLVYKGIFEIPFTVVCGFAGSFVSDWLYYLIGRANGKYFVSRRPDLQRRLSPVRRFFEHHQVGVLLSYRFLYGFRVIIPLVIGMSDVQPRRFLMFSVASGLLWSFMLSMIGYTIGRFLDLETSAFERNIVWIILGFAAFGLLLGFAINRTFKAIARPENHNETGL